MMDSIPRSYRQWAAVDDGRSLEDYADFEANDLVIDLPIQHAPNAEANVSLGLRESTSMHPYCCLDDDESGRLVCH